MDPSRRKPALLAALAVALAGAVYVRWPAVEPPRGATTASRGGPARAAANATLVTAPDVRLETLNAPRPAPGAAARNLFGFKPKFVPAPIHVQAPPKPITPIGPPPPPAVPPIALKFIGVLESADAARVAILSDGLGAPIYGKEGDAVLGQYRILRIGSDSIEMGHLDGRGRQTIRLSGS